MLRSEEVSAKVHAVLEANKEDVLRRVKMCLTLAGMRLEGEEPRTDWVISPLNNLITELGLPSVSMSRTIEETEFWHVAGGQPLPWDPYGGRRAAAIAKWQEAVQNDGAIMGFEDWWDDAIETNRHNL